MEVVDGASESLGIRTESSALSSKWFRSSSLGPVSNGPMFKKGGPQNCNELFKNSAVGPEIIGLYSKGEANG